MCVRRPLEFPTFSLFKVGKRKEIEKPRNGYDLAVFFSSKLILSPENGLPMEDIRAHASGEYFVRISRSPY